MLQPWYNFFFFLIYSTLTFVYSAYMRDDAMQYRQLPLGLLDPSIFTLKTLAGRDCVHKKGRPN